jgi:glyceraldehyde 3-phosphate dehydrogenase
VKVGINGMGRIGTAGAARRLGAAERPADDPRAGNRLEVVHLNELKGGAAATAHLLEFDSVQGRWRAASPPTATTPSASAIAGWASRRTPPRRRDPLGRPGRGRGAGVHRQVPDARDAARPPGPRRQARDRGRAGEGGRRAEHRRRRQPPPVRPGAHRIVTAASCTTNCLAPVVKVVHEAIGIRHGQITTIHDPTNTNLVVDAPHKDLRRARSAMLSLAPTTTGSATAIALIYPELKGKLNGHAVRAPVLNASLTDCVFELQRETTAERSTRCSPRPRAGRWPASWATRSGRWSAPTTPATRAAASSMRCRPWSPTARC